MLTTERADTYFNYNDYAETKALFLKKLNDNYDKDFLKNTFNYLKTQFNDAYLFEDVFKELQKHLTQDHILGYWSTDKGCRYINYVLNNECNDIISYLSSLQLEPPAKKEELDRHNQRPAHQIESEPKVQSETRDKVVEHMNALRSPETETTISERTPTAALPSIETEPFRGADSSIGEPSTMGSISRTEDESSLEDPTHDVQIRQQEEQFQEAQYPIPPIYPGMSVYRAELGHPYMKKEQSEGGFLNTVKDAFSTISENVDPVPVVGVSGGMGALFLLFRYTPVGTFFRGGRGRARRIPSGFSGPFPGEFPNFQDYEGGYIGYGPMNINPLAE
ncbi:VIR protein [Plasmodium vivax]|uniref:VIR protein n=1 Tax=Plasmodium vivax TaxID=5855 RepID=A0A1G4EID8_PLAVI|nr:VIR protein [Plasmodium vivax]